MADLQALATCLKYVELNPVRAKIVDDPADYRFCSYVRWQQSGRQPFARSFAKHMVSALKVYLDTQDIKGLESYFRQRFAAIVRSERDGNRGEADMAVKSAGKKKNLLMVRSRFWIDSMVLGSQVVLKEHAAQYWGKDRAKLKRFGVAYFEDDLEVFSMRQLLVKGTR